MSDRVNAALAVLVLVLGAVAVGWLIWQIGLIPQ